MERPIEPIMPTMENKTYLIIFGVFCVILLGVGIAIGYFIPK